MDILKFFVVIMILALGVAFAEEHIHRKGKCGHSMPMPMKFKERTNLKKNKFNVKPLPIKNDYAPVPPPERTPASPAEDDLSLDVRGDYGPPPSKDNTRPVRDYPKRLTISDDGVVSYARSLNLNKVRTFHADDHAEEANAEQHDEGRDTFHKIRTARGVKDATQLSSTLGAMQGEGTQTLNDVSAGNSATAGDYFTLEATGLNISATHFGNSVSSGEGSVSVSGSTTNSVVSPGPGSGWKKP